MGSSIFIQTKIGELCQMNNHNSIWLNGQVYFLDDCIKKLTTPLEDWERAIFTFLVEWFDDSVVINTKTSGSTGRPKLISQPKNKMRASAKMTGNFLSFKKSQNALLCLPAQYVAGKMMLVRAIEWQLHLYAIAPTIHLKIPNILFDFCAMIPPQVEENWNQLPQIKKLIIGGAPVSKLLQNKIKDLPTQCFETYGMTETVSHVAMKNLQENTPWFSALPQVTFSVNDSNCLCIHAPFLEKKTIETTDIVRLFSPSKFEWLGRKDHVINSGGKKYHPEELEFHLAEVITSNFFIGSLPDPKWGQKLILVIEGESTAQIVDIESISKLISFKLPPENVYFLPIFELTPTGKIDRNKTLRLLCI